MNIDTSMMKVINITRELIAFLIVHNEYIKQAYYTDLSFSKHFVNLPEVIVFNKLIYLYERDNKVTLGSLKELFIKEPSKDVNQNFFNDIANNEEFLHADRDNNSCEKKYKQLLVNMSKAKSYYIKNYKSVQILMTKDETERTKLMKELAELKKSNKK